MRILIIESHRNGAVLANRLCLESTAVDHVWLATRDRPTGAWGRGNLSVMPAPVAVSAVLELVESERIDLVVNYDPVIGKAGVCEGLKAAGISTVGCTAELASAEIDKRAFKKWLLENNFQTPVTLLEGSYAEIERRAKDLDYPLVIKPHAQIGPTVSVCHSPAELLAYLEWTAQRVPYAKFGVVFAIEQHVHITEELFAANMFCNGRGFLSSAVHPSTPSRDTRGRAIRPPECMFGVTRCRENGQFKAELLRYATLMAGRCVAGHAQAQCGIASDGQLYFIECNARPGSWGGAFGMFDDPMDGLRCLQSGDHETFARHLPEVDADVQVGLSLQHREDGIPIDYETLRKVFGRMFVASSVEQQDGQYISRRAAIPSFVMFEAATPEGVINQISGSLAAIRETGAYLPINLDALRCQLAV